MTDFLKTNEMEWKSIELARLQWLEIDYKTDQALGQFLQDRQCLWLSSCWPSFKQDTAQDVIALDMTDWLLSPSNQPGLHQLLKQDKERGTELKLQAEEAQLPLQWMSQQLTKYQSLNKDILAKLPIDIRMPGWYGGLSYAYGDQLTVKHQIQRSSWPDAVLGFAKTVITLDHQQQKAWILSLSEQTAFEALLQQWRSASASDILLECKVGPWQAQTSQEEYIQGFNTIQDHLKAGDTYQVNYTQCFESSYEGHPLGVFLKLKQQSPSPYAAYWSMPWGCVSSHSPELLLETQSNPYRARSKPIKGTTPRRAEPLEDQEAAAALQASPKNRAENTMIVDLLRNDLSKSAIAGTMRVPHICAVESYAHIHHLVSEIQTQIKPEINPMQVLLSCFPGGSITGAPKRRAMEIIDALEKTPRDIYCGTIGYWDTPEHSVFNITIRTFQFNPEQQNIKIWAGGGIVIASTAPDEYEECFHKVLKLMKGLEY